MISHPTTETHHPKSDQHPSTSLCAFNVPMREIKLLTKVCLTEVARDCCIINRCMVSRPTGIQIYIVAKAVATEVDYIRGIASYLANCFVSRSFEEGLVGMGLVI